MASSVKQRGPNILSREAVSPPQLEPRKELNQMPHCLVTEDGKLVVTCKMQKLECG